MCSVFIKYMYTCTKPFSNFQNLSGVNGVDICDVTFTAGGGTLLWQYVTRGRGVWKGEICGDVINGQPAPIIFYIYVIKYSTQMIELFWNIFFKKYMKDLKKYIIIFPIIKINREINFVISRDKNFKINWNCN